MDNRSVKRGACTRCTDCSSYNPKELKEASNRPSRCVACGCPPGLHENLNESDRVLTVKSTRDSFPTCLLCSNEAHLDVNTGKGFKFCLNHLAGLEIDSEEEEISNTSNSSHNLLVYSARDQLANIPQAKAIPSQGMKCAIEECSNPCHVDENGTVHECCGYTHAMELIRRKTLEQMKQKIVKGVTHCFLPTCNKVTWPFMNYCGRTHAQKGKEMGLTPPVQTSMPKTPSQCELPGCTRPKYKENGMVHNYCGISHAEEAKKIKTKGPKTSEMCLLKDCFKPKHKESDGTLHPYCSIAHAEEAKSNAVDESIPKDESLCIIPECTRPKHRDPSGNIEFDCCGRTHAEEAKKRNIQPVLKSMTEVKQFLSTFSNLTVVDMTENVHAKAGGVLYKKFIAARSKLGQNDRKTCLAFHGTPETNIPSICANGYDPSKRRGQSYGPGEYFACTPTISLGYCQSGSKKLLLNELLLGQAGVHHTKTGDIIVMKNPEHDLPRFVITFR